VKTVGIFVAYAVVLLTGLEIQKYDLLLGHTLGVFGILGVTFFLVDHLARKVL
jgi:hypothetical protein